jgi:biopolymer transport protein ExbD
MALGKLPDSDADEGEGDAIFAEINITPLTDVFLVLVIIFMVSALAVQVERNQEKQHQVDEQKDVEESKKSGLKITLPSGRAQEIDTAKTSIVLEIPVKGDINVGGKAMTTEDLDNLFQAAFVRDKQTQVIFKADKLAAHGRVVDLMEHAKQAGLTHLAIQTSGS